MGLLLFPPAILSPLSFSLLVSLPVGWRLGLVTLLI
jgi:hypothetical protein